MGKKTQDACCDARRLAYGRAASVATMARGAYYIIQALEHLWSAAQSYPCLSAGYSPLVLYLCVSTSAGPHRGCLRKKPFDADRARESNEPLTLRIATVLSK